VPCPQTITESRGSVSDSVPSDQALLCRHKPSAAGGASSRSPDCCIAVRSIVKVNSLAVHFPLRRPILIRRSCRFVLLESARAARSTFGDAHITSLKRKVSSLAACAAYGSEIQKAVARYIFDSPSYAVRQLAMPATTECFTPLAS
jgi:hypothetical protein